MAMPPKDEFGEHVRPIRILSGAAALTRSTVTMTGASGPLVPADSSRKIVIVSSTKTNASAAIDPAGGVCALDAGMPIEGGDTLQITGAEAQSAMTQIGTNGQKLTVWQGF